MKNWRDNIERKNMVRNQDLKPPNKRKAAKSTSTYVFLILYIKIPQDKLLHVLNEITDLTFMVRKGDGGGGQDIMLLFIVQEIFGGGQEVKVEDLTLSKKRNLV